jgi:hypothetical protein
MNFLAKFAKSTCVASMGASAAAVLAAGLLLPAVVSAAPAPATGTLVGVVTCGADESTPAAHIAVVVEGMNVRTVTDSAGRFVLSNVPVGPNLTIDAVGDAQTSLVSSRFNVVAQAGQTLDIGSMDVAICVQPAPAPAVDNQGPGDNGNPNAA